MPLARLPGSVEPVHARARSIASVVSVAGKTAGGGRGDEASSRARRSCRQPLVTNFIASRPRAAGARSRTPPAGAPPETAAPARQGGRGRRGRQGGAGGRQGGRRGGRPAGSADRRSGDSAGAAPPCCCKPSRGDARHACSSQAGRDNPHDPLPKVVLAGEHYNMIARLLAAQGPGEAARQRAGAVPRAGSQLLQRPRRDSGHRSGAAKIEVVMLGAHLDSWHTAHGRDRQRRRLGRRDGGVPDSQGDRRCSRGARCGSRSGAARSRACSARAPTSARTSPATPTRRRATRWPSTSTSIPARGRSTAGILENNDAAQADLRRLAGAVRGQGSARSRTSVRASATPTTCASSRRACRDSTRSRTTSDYDVREHHTNADTAERIKEQRSEAERDDPGVVRLSRGDAHGADSPCAAIIAFRKSRPRASEPDLCDRRDSPAARRWGDGSWARFSGWLRRRWGGSRARAGVGRQGRPESRHGEAGGH